MLHFEHELLQSQTIEVRESRISRNQIAKGMLDGISELLIIWT